jgi:putative transposase
MLYSAYQDGSRIQTDKGLARVQILNPNLCVLFDEDDNPLLQTHEQMQAALKSGTYIVEIPDVAQLVLTDYQINDKDTRLMYVNSLMKIVTEHDVRPTTNKAYKLMIDQVERDYPITRAVEKHPAKSSVCRYWRAWVNGRCFDNVLVSARRDAPTRVHPASEAILCEFVGTTWQNSQSKLRSAHYRAYCMTVKEASKKDNNILAVSERTFYRRIGELNTIEDELKRSKTGSARHNHLLLTMQRKLRAHSAMDRVEMDRIDLNLCLIDDETGEVTGKVSIYFAIDCYTRAVVGTVVDTGLAECKESVVNLFQQVYMKDDNLPFRGKPQIAAMDNGSGFIAATIHLLCEHLGITPVYVPPNSPSKKPFVESFNNSFRRNFCEGLAVNIDGKLTVGVPGYIGVNNGKGHDNTTISPAKAAVLSKRDFLYSLNTFLCEYSHKKHSSTQKSPHELWFESLNERPRTHYDYEAVVEKFHVLQSSLNQKLYSNGTVRLLNHIFSSPELKQLYIKTKSLNAEARVVVTFNPFDARYVTVRYFDDRSRLSYRIVAENIEIEDMPKSISFKALKGETENSVGIYQGTKHTVTGDYKVFIDKLHPQSTRRKKRGKETSSFEENNKQNLSAEDRIKQSNTNDSKESVILEANMRYKTDEPKMTKVEIKDHMKVDTNGEEPLW